MVHLLLLLLAVFRLKAYCKLNLLYLKGKYLHRFGLQFY